MATWYSCLENPVDRGAWLTRVHGNMVTKNPTRLGNSIKERRRGQKSEVSLVVWNPGRAASSWMQWRSCSSFPWGLRASVFHSTSLISSPAFAVLCAQRLQLSPTLCDPMDRSTKHSSVHGIPQAWTGVGCHFLLQGIFLTQGSNPHLLGLLHWQVDSLLLRHRGRPTYPHCPSLILQSNLPWPYIRTLVIIFRDHLDNLRKPPRSKSFSGVE